MGKLSRLLREFFLIDLITGLKVTGPYLWKEKFTIQYPKERVQPKRRFRGALRLARDPEFGEELCIGCQKCGKACPDDCITVTMEKRQAIGPLGFKTRHKSFEIDLSRCMWCDLCVEVCPTEAILSTDDFELATYDRADMLFDVTSLYGPIPKKVYTK